MAKGSTFTTGAKLCGGTGRLLVVRVVFSCEGVEGGSKPKLFPLVEIGLGVGASLLHPSGVGYSRPELTELENSVGSS